jgi:hypothetical protein
MRCGDTGVDSMRSWFLASGALCLLTVRAIISRADVTRARTRVRCDHCDGVSSRVLLTGEGGFVRYRVVITISVSTCSGGNVATAVSETAVVSMGFTTHVRPSRCVAPDGHHQASWKGRACRQTRQTCRQWWSQLAPKSRRASL